MPNLGKYLAFALRYPAEMSYLCWTPDETGEEPDMEGVPDGPAVLRRARAVSEEACREAAALLEAVAPVLEATLKSLGQVRRFRRNLRQAWGLKYAIRPEDGRPDYFEAGAFIDGRRARLCPWWWFRTSLTAEVARRLGEAGVEAWQEGGSIYLSELSLFPPGATGEDSDISSVLCAVPGQFAGLTPGLLKDATRAASGEA